jgi:hypothetical protein
MPPERARIVVGVLSGKNEHERREACRKTWMGDFYRAGVPSFFLVGNQEQQVHNDMLYLHCPDDYGSLPQKTRGFCNFALKKYDFDYLFKCDDDTYVQVERFVQYDPMGRDYIGVDPTGEDTFNSGGAGYFLSRRAAQIVADELTEQTGPEDLLVGRLLARHGIYRSEDKRFQAWWQPHAIPTPENDGITVHYVRGERMAEVHGGFKQGGR